MQVPKLIRKVVAAMIREPHKEYMLLVETEDEKRFIEDQLILRLNGILTSHRSNDRYRRQIVFTTMLHTKLRLILVDNMEEFDYDTCGVTIDKWWSTLEFLPRNIKLRLFCCSREFQNGQRVETEKGVQEECE
jgi:hypothetical protein